MSAIDTNAARILVVEDEHTVRELVRLILNHEGWDIAEADSLTEAAECVRTKKPPFDLLILDICLPDGFGTQLVEKMRHNGANPKVLYMTGDPGWLRRLGAEGAALLPKPFTPRQMIEAVQQALV